MKALLDSPPKLVLSTLWRVETLPLDQLTARERTLGRVLGTAAVAIILITAAIHGAKIYNANLDTAFFYQTSFGPAVNFACNGQFSETKPNEQVKLFLERKSPTLDSCSGVEGLPVTTTTSLARSMVYLEIASAILWRVFGFNWEILGIIAAALASGFALACYGLLRIFLESRLVAAWFTYLLMSSLPVVAQIPHLRDFSKASFLIGAIACMAAATLRQHRPFITLSYALGAGALVSLGLGFRPDLKLAIPIVIAAPLLSFGSDTLLRTVARVFLVWAGFAASYLALQLPLELVTGASNSTPATFIPHVFILGFAEVFLHDALGMPDSPYSVLRAYFDEFAYANVNLFAGEGDRSRIIWGSIEYEKHSAELLKSILQLIPSDALFRVFYTANAIGHLPLNSSVWGLPLLFAIPIIAIMRPRHFLFAIIVFGIFTAALTLQYHERHAFFMTLFGPILLALSFRALLDIACWIHDQGLRFPPWTGSRIGFFWLSAGCLVIALAAVFQFLAAAQRNALERAARTYQSLEWESIRFQPLKDGIEPLFIGDRDKIQRISFALKHPTDRDTGTSPRVEAFSRVTMKLQPAVVEATLVELSWAAVQEKSPLPGKAFALSTKKAGYAVESSPISGSNLRTLVGQRRDGRHILALKATGETLSGEFHIGVLNADKTKFAFIERLPQGKWQYRKQFEIDPDLDEFTILFSKPLGGRSSIRVDAVDLVAVPEPNCWSPNARITADYSYFGKQISFGGPLLPDRAGHATYYFPQSFSEGLGYKALNLGGISPDCVVDWSVAKNFPAGTVPAELLLVDGQMSSSQRGDWVSIWRAFVN